MLCWWDFVSLELIQHAHTQRGLPGDMFLAESRDADSGKFC